MKKYVVFAGLLMGTILADAQSKPANLDSSPLDMSYYPVDYPVLKIQDKAKDPLIARVVYSRPQKKGRTLFGDLVAYGQVAFGRQRGYGAGILFSGCKDLDNKKSEEGTLYPVCAGGPGQMDVCPEQETDTGRFCV